VLHTKKCQEREVDQNGSRDWLARCGIDRFGDPEIAQESSHVGIDSQEQYVSRRTIKEEQTSSHRSILGMGITRSNYVPDERFVAWPQYIIVRPGSRQS
jgi:hypothetical protein